MRKEASEERKRAGEKRESLRALKRREVKITEDHRERERPERNQREKRKQERAR